MNPWPFGRRRNSDSRLENTAVMKSSGLQRISSSSASKGYFISSRFVTWGDFRKLPALAGLGAREGCSEFFDHGFGAAELLHPRLYSCHLGSCAFTQFPIVPQVPYCQAD